MSYYNGPNIITNGLVMYLDAANRKSYLAGSNWYDLSGNGNNASLSGTTTLTNGFLNFTGNSTATVTYNSSLSFGGANKIGTIEAVGYFSNSSSDGSFMYTSALVVINPTSPGYMLCGTIVPSYLGNCMVSTSTNGAVRIGKLAAAIGSQLSPVYSAMVFNGTSVTVYANMTQYSFTWTDANDIAGSMDGANTIIGGLPAGGASQNVFVSIARQYNRALSPAEILQNYNATKTRFGL
jgi:hypothetical protein